MGRTVQEVRVVVVVRVVGGTSSGVCGEEGVRGGGMQGSEVARVRSTQLYDRCALDR